MPRSLSAVSSLEVRNLNYDQIRFYHPGYLKPLNLLFCLPRVDYSAEDNAYGVHYRTALTACQIVANNAFEKGRLARDDKGQDIVADDEKVLLERDYWFFIEDDERYAVVPCFNDWQFPHDKLPDWWIAPTSSLGLHTKRCAVTNTSYAFTWAHLIPKEEQQWFNKNGMGLYGGGSHSLDDQHNILPLKADLYVCFDQSVFALVPKQHREPNGELRTEYVLHVLDARESEFAALYQDRPIKCLVSGSREYLFARFAWTVISRIKPFLTSGVGRRVVRFRVRACDGDTDEENLRAEMQNVFMDAKKLEALYGGGGRKRAVSLEGAYANDEWEEELPGEMEGYFFDRLNRGLLTHNLRLNDLGSRNNLYHRSRHFHNLRRPPPIPTFNVIASGGGPAADTRLSASCRAPFITFDYEAGDASAEFFSIEPDTGRLKTSNPDTYVCATFGENGQPAGTAYLVNCIQQNIDVGDDYITYLSCDLNQGKITCAAPWKNCNRDNFEWMCYPDETGSVMAKLFVTPHNAWGYAVGMARDVPNGYSEVEWTASVV
ncbi:hypothetical protein LRP88_13065 [Fusarium phalaenopsidis]